MIEYLDCLDCENATLPDGMIDVWLTRDNEKKMTVTLGNVGYSKTLLAWRELALRIIDIADNELKKDSAR